MIEIIWITSAACKNDSSLAAKNESKCYYIHAYEDQGIKAKLIDLTGLIRSHGYETTYAERGGVRFAVSVCRPMEGVSSSRCNGAMACLVNQTGHTITHQPVPLPLGYQVGGDSNLHMEGGLLTAVYTSRGNSCDNNKRLVKVHFLCPSGVQVNIVRRLSPQEGRRDGRSEGRRDGRSEGRRDGRSEGRRMGGVKGGGMGGVKGGRMGG